MIHRKMCSIMPKKISKFPPLEELHQIFVYDPETGIVTRKGRSGQVGSIKEKGGYRRFTYKGKRYYIHRLVWFLYYGVEATSDIDHKNMNRNDNRIDNLREVTRNVNNANTPARGKSGIKGVYEYRPGRWMVRLTVNDVRTTYGYYDSFEEAKQRSIEVRSKIYGDVDRYA
jgi:hypothetical protein